MDTNRLSKVILMPHVSEKSVMIADNVKQQTFKVASNASKNDVKEAIEKFYDTVIANGNIEFNILESIPCANECANFAQIVNVVGDVKIETQMIVIYRVNSNDKIVSLRAFWDYKKMEDQLKAIS